jgi:hypothetical protein
MCRGADLIHLLQFHGDQAESSHKFIQALLSQAIVLLLLGVALGGDLFEILSTLQELLLTLPVLLEDVQIRFRTLELFWGGL